MCYRGYNAPWVMSTNGVDGVGEALALPLRPTHRKTNQHKRHTMLPALTCVRAVTDLRALAETCSQPTVGSWRATRPKAGRCRYRLRGRLPSSFQDRGWITRTTDPRSHGIVVEQLAEALGADWRDTAEMTNTCERCVTAVTALGAEWDLAGRRGCRRCPARPTGQRAAPST